MSNPLLFIANLCILGCAFVISIFLVSKKNKKEYALKLRIEDSDGRINIAYQQLQVEESRNRALCFKLKRYDALALLTDKLNQNLSLDDTLDTLLNESYAMLGSFEFVGILYLNDAATNTLSLARIKSNSPDTIVKEKNGNIFDQWALKHTQALLVEDTSSDFRFDSERLRNASQRFVGSVIVSPLVSQNRTIGLMHFDSRYLKAFNLEDLRLLNTVADIASVAIDNAQLYQRTRQLAIKDGLTGLYTHKFIIERLEEELKRCMHSGVSISVVMLDIDFFKRYNDQYGHLAGDAVLKNLSVYLGDYFKKHNAIVGRFGGEEFLIILPQAAKQEAYLAAENIRAVIQEKIVMIRRKLTTFTVSMGIACFPQDAQQANELLDKADSALYEAKRTGRNRVCLY